MYIYGKNVAREKLVSNDKILKVYLSEKFSDKEILDLIYQKKIKINYTNKYDLDKKSEGGLHQGIVLSIDDVKTYTYDDIIPKLTNKYKTVVMLDHLEDPHNFGAIIRTSEALGVDAIIIPNDRSININATVIKTSTGAINNIKIIRVANLVSTIEKLKKDNFWIVGTDMSSQNYTEIDYKTSICLIIGNEGKGISRVVRNACDYIASIKMVGKINSLNASVSCGIILEQINRSRLS